MTTPRQALGQRGEALAASHMESQGWTVVARNVRTPYGEIDLIARDGATLVFIEVKTRRSKAYGRPEESVTALKQSHLRNATQTYVQDMRPMPEWRIDVMALALGRDGSIVNLEHIRSAVGE